jgi:SAM-dependent methyltransferase
MRYFPFPAMMATERVQKYFSHEERMIAVLDDFFWKVFDYLRANEIQGDYLEFGCGFKIRTFRLAAKYQSILYSSPRLFAFDSFEGLPKPEGIDIHPGWNEGSMAVSIEDFREVMQLQGLEKDEYSVVAGHFKKTLLGHKPPEYGLNKASFVYVDCDLYMSTGPVLEFVGDILAHGAILAFDDWNCYRSEPNRGEQRAFWEFCKARNDLSFAEFLPVGWHGRSFIVHRNDEMEG